MTTPQQIRELADRMDDEIQSKLDPAIGRQRMTARRIRIAQGMRLEGQRLQRVQRALRMGADLMELDAIPEEFRNFRWTKANVMACTFESLCTPIAEWVRSLIEPPKPEDERAKAIRLAEEALYGLKIPGYFPTPPALAKRMVEMAQLQYGDRVLEPSAGKGNIIDQIPLANGFDVLCFEIAPVLRDILKMKYHSPYEGHRGVLLSQFPDFMAEPGQRAFGAVIMNPPFERGQDCKHVTHALRFLKPGGRLVAITSPSWTYRCEEPFTSFRRYMSRNNAYVEDLAPGTFGDSGTNVASKLIKIVL